MHAPLIPPVTARSAVLSLLLGADPPTLSGREIVAVMGLFGVSESAARVALTRMVAKGDLTRSDGRYTLSDRLVRRQRDLAPPRRRVWTGEWEMAVITVTGRSAADRVALRGAMARRRVAELREGVWTRPANLIRTWPESLAGVALCFQTRPLDDPAVLVERLWDLPAWADRGHAYLEALAAAEDEPTRFVTMVAAVRHLQTDPLLPTELLPDDWPGAELDTAYADYRGRLAAMRERFAAAP